jgi:hypothetical protein
MRNAEVIYSYSRAQAIDDGVLVDVSAMAKEAGFRYAVALTAAAWADCVAWPENRRGAGQSETGRLWDVLWMTKLAIKGAGGDRVSVSVLRVPAHGGRPTLAALQAMVGPGDAWEPVITIMLPGED